MFPPAIPAASNAAPPTPVVQNEGESNEETKRVTERLIPDQKALLGTTETTLDLKTLFEGTELGASGESIIIEVLRAKRAVAVATVRY
jgi:hypothetical protein